MKSEELFERAKRCIPGGVNSPVRAFKSVGGTPRFISRARGAMVEDVDGNVYIDYVSSWGPLILGHAHEETMEVLLEAMERGWSYGAPVEIEIGLAELICRAVPSIELVRMVNSGTEATMSALRLARAYTGRDLAIKFSGCYHGHADSFLVQAGSGLATLGIPGSPGVTEGTSKGTLVCPYNDLDAVSESFARHRNEVAAVIVEPVAGNMGVVAPKAGFLEGLREITEREGALLIFDEVITGFRLAPGGAQELYSVMPDLTTLGKIIGGGFPVGAYGGRREIMEMISPEGPVYQAGTLSGNPIAMTAGYTTLRALTQGRAYEELERKGSYLEKGLSDAISPFSDRLKLNRVGSMMTLFFAPEEVVDFETARKSDTELYARYFHEMLERGVYIAPSQFEACFVSTAHDELLLDRTIEAASDAIQALFK